MTEQSKRALTPTIVLSAFAANPSMSSETGIGWSFIRATARNARLAGAHVVVVMNKRSEQPVRQELVSEGLDGLVEPIGIDMPGILRFLKDPRLTRIEYLVWWLLAQGVMRKLERERNVVLAHHVTFATEVFPTPITVFSGQVLKVWGPIGSAGDPAVYRVRPLSAGVRREALTQRVRDLVAAIPATYFGKRVDIVLAQNGAVAEVFAKRAIRTRIFPNVVLKPELQDAIESARNSRTRPPLPIEGIRILSVGHLVPRKRFDLGISVLRDPLLRNSHYQLLGRPLEGVKDDLPRLAKSIGVEERVQFSGKLSRDDVLSAMANSDVLFHPSGREGASGVIGEATAVGIPVVCFGNTGASSVLRASGSNGVVIQANSNLSMSDIAQAIVEAASLPRVHTSLWTEARFQDLCTELLYEAMQRLQADARQIQH